jgi:hypothetical protein
MHTNNTFIIIWNIPPRTSWALEGFDPGLTELCSHGRSRARAKGHEPCWGPDLQNPCAHFPPGHAHTCEPTNSGTRTP